ncbi:hypothetical protein SAMN02745146_0252 [Hymenobacter daecheongensis DSM 21074]|uniref:Antitoxin VbhA domain-containing protein n=1 Tax=Hymenobacter daecheongensis DSM 21074 TaxID=1121955 RepID=A0A1M6MEA6_9BACT|nr:antitoxin VbhA family protein [Hymenobacter daecheongensis]SHJ81852.1 hypothetical protein SAMN02745146_0252 [Hymenobacter daecheongensis DSM 21074]
MKTPFNPLPAGLSEAETAARLKRQRCAEWGVAVAALGGTPPSPEIISELQRYIDGEITLAEFALADEFPAYQAVVTRERLVA